MYACALAAAGAAIAVTGRSATQLRETVELIEAAGGRAIPINFDVADPDAVNCAVNEIQEHLGEVDILVNNAGVSGPSATRGMRILILVAYLRDARARNLSVLARRVAGNDPARRWSNHQHGQPCRSLSLSDSFGLLGFEGCCYQAH